MLNLSLPRGKIENEAPIKIWKLGHVENEDPKLRLGAGPTLKNLVLKLYEPGGRDLLFIVRLVLDPHLISLRTAMQEPTE